MKLTIELTDEEMTRLQALIDWRTKLSKGKVKYTPDRCIKSFINSCQTGSGWIHPERAARQYEAKKRTEAQAADTKKDVVSSSTS